MDIIRNRDHRISLFVTFTLAMILTILTAMAVNTGFAFAAGEDGVKEASSITFLPSVNSYDIEEVRVKDDDGGYWLDIGQRGKEEGRRSFFTGGDRCLVKYEDEPDQIFWFREAESADRAVFRSSGSGDEITLTAVSEQTEPLHREMGITVDDLAVFIGVNPVKISCGDLEYTCKIGVTEQEQEEHDCRDSLLTMQALEASCEGYGTAESVSEFYWCHVCGNFYDSMAQARDHFPINMDSGFFTEPLGHDWEVIETIKEVTPEEAGLEKIRCTRCGKEQERVIPRDLVNITEQPEDLEVDFPDSASFHVGVDHPENVKSYRWELRVKDDGGGKDAVYQLNGSSAKTDTLTLPATEHDLHPYHFRCYITDVDGNVITSEEAVMTIRNPDEDKMVLYVGEYAAEPGETLDLSEINYGSGTITYDEDKFNVEFNKVRFENSHPTFDQSYGASTGILLSTSGTPAEFGEYYMHFNGGCEINNTFFDHENNTGGIALNGYFGCGNTGNTPSLVITGDSPVTFVGGTYAVYADGDVVIDNDIVIRRDSLNYNNGIRGHNILFYNDVAAELNCVGTALETKNGDIRLYRGAEVKIDTIAPHISKGHTATSAVLANGGGIYLTGAVLDIKDMGVAETVVPYHRYIANMNGIKLDGNMSISDSTVNIDLDCEDAEESFASNFNGIMGTENASLVLTKGSEMNIRIDDEKIFGACGISLERRLIAESGSSVKVDVSSDGRATGIWMESALNIEDSTVDVRTTSASSEEGLESRGIICDTANIALNDSAHYVHSLAEGGGGQGTEIAYIAGDAGFSYEKAGYDPDFVSKLTKLSGRAEITIPEKHQISGYNYKVDSWYMGSEALYDISTKEATAKPAKEMMIKAAPKANPMKVSPLRKTFRLKAGALRKKAKTVKTFKVKGAEGRLTYTVSVKGKAKKYLKFNKKTRKLTIKKGAKKGRYVMKVRVRAAGSAGYSAASKTVRLIVLVR